MKNSPVGCGSWGLCSRCGRRTVGRDSMVLKLTTAEFKALVQCLNLTTTVSQNQLLPSVLLMRKSNAEPALPGGEAMAKKPGFSMAGPERIFKYWPGVTYPAATVAPTSTVISLRPSAASLLEVTCKRKSTIN